MHLYTHASISRHLYMLVLQQIMQAKMNMNQIDLISQIDTDTHRHTQSYWLCGSRHGAVEIKAGQAVICYLRLLHAHALDSHQRHVPHFSSALASSEWDHTRDIAAFSLLWV